MSSFKEVIHQELNEALKVLDSFINQPKNIELIEEAAIILATSFKNKGKVLSCGNEALIAMQCILPKS